jgi:hypothetical protein
VPGAYGALVDTCLPPDGEVIRISHSIKLPVCYESRTL